MNRPSKPLSKFPPETKAADAVTVAWMLSMLSTLGSLSVAGVLAIGGAMAGGFDGEPSPLDTAPSLLFFIALICGTICLGLTYLTGRVRKTQPPTGITMFALMTGIAPWIIYVVLTGMRWA